MLRKITGACAAATLVAAMACAPADAPVDARASLTDTTNAPADSTGIILFLGTSLTAGYGIGAEFAYPALIQQKLDSLDYPLRVVNAGLSGETSAGGLRRIDWSLQQPIAVLVLELGANDGLRGLPISSLRKNLREIIERTRKRYPDAAIVIAGMEAPPNLGGPYTTEFRNVFGDIAEEFDAALIPFLLEGVAAVPELNQDDGIHPNVEGQQRVAANVWKVLHPVIQRQLANSQAPAATR
ncbi:MAG TPA: arylesterase [Longimicrobiales bacterium]